MQERVRRVARQPFYVRFARFRAGQIVEAERGDAADGSAVLAAVAGVARSSSVRYRTHTAYGGASP